MRMALISLACCGALLGCHAGAREQARGNEVKTLLEEIYERAYRCSPKALAQASANADFGLRELEQGDFRKARLHMDSASAAAQKADVRSRGPECLPPKLEPAKPIDKDGDGIVDAEDQCPSDPEDHDAFEDRDGCPDNDNDNDRIADVADGCPMDPEDYDGVEDEDGCPDETKDADGDGIVDNLDACPQDPEDKDGFQDEDGCPELDNDRDGLADTVDKCPLEPEDKDGFEDDNGCPDNDNDNDGITDLKDGCPNKPEDYDGDADEDGCPDLYKLVVVTKERIELKQKVHFATNKAKILSKSFPLLNEVAQVLLDNPEMSVRIEGHTDSRGDDKYNKKLSTNRAESVRLYMQRQGIDSARIKSLGYGEEKPIEDNATKDGRAANRRVEFHIVEK